MGSAGAVLARRELDQDHPPSEGMWRVLSPTSIEGAVVKARENNFLLTDPSQSKPQRLLDNPWAF